MSKIERQKHLLHGAEPKSTITRKLQHHFSICSLKHILQEKLLPEAANLGEQEVNLTLTSDGEDSSLWQKRWVFDPLETFACFFSLSSGLPLLDD